MFASNICLNLNKIFSKKQYASYLLWPKSWKMIEEKVFAKQQVLSKLAKKTGSKSLLVQIYQNQLMSSVYFRLVAVKRIKSNRSSQIRGIDNFIPKGELEWRNLVEEIANLEQYKSLPVKRIHIYKDNGKIRLLGIPIIYDRAVQSLFKLVTEPITEIHSDLNSYSFCKNRSSIQALARVCSILRSKKSTEEIVIFNLDINNFFNDINHDWLLKLYPISTKYRHVLKNWLTSGVLINQKLKKILLDVPQCGIISLVISNFVLAGLEDIIKARVIKITKSKTLVQKYYRDKSGINAIKRFNIQFVRYIDNFLITCWSMFIAKIFIKPVIVQFLSERGIRFFEGKSSISRLKDTDLKYLGYRFFFRKSWKLRGLSREKAGLPVIGVIPQKQKFKAVCLKIKNIFYFNLNLQVYTLIARVNLIIIGWCNYYRYGQLVIYRKKLEHYLFKLVWEWARKKHRRWGKKQIASFYFLDKCWARSNVRGCLFSGQIYNNSRFKNKDLEKRIYLVNPTTSISKFLMSRRNNFKTHKTISGYHSNVKKFENHNLVQQDKKKQIFLKKILFTKQKGVCSICLQTIKIGEVIQIHYTTSIILNKFNNSVKNMRLLHKECHIGHYDLIGRGFSHCFKAESNILSIPVS